MDFSNALAKKAVLLLFSGAFLTACSSLPRSGPDDSVVATNATATLTSGRESFNAYQYALVDVSKDILPFLFDPGPGSLYRSFGGGRGPAPEIRVGVGDVIQVTVFESSAGGLFIPAEAGVRPGNYVTFPQQSISGSGMITVPYAGSVRAKGRTLPQIEADIVSRLANRAIEPQVTVALIEQKATDATVAGAVNSPGTFNVRSSGDRVLDLISRAGGLKHGDYESFITLTRRGKQATIFFNTLAQKAKENIYVAPGDTVYVYRTQRSFLAFGATGVSGQVFFDAEKVSLAEAVGKVGGLIDNRADPAQVLLYRNESRKTLKKMGVELEKFDQGQKKIPTIYRANFRNPASYFFAQKFPMRDQDVLYVSNADAVELIKFLDVLNSVTSTAAGVSADTRVVRDNVRSLVRD